MPARMGPVRTRSYSVGSECSDGSGRSRSTAPTDYSGYPRQYHAGGKREYLPEEPSWEHQNRGQRDLQLQQQYLPYYGAHEHSGARDSVQTYASTVSSEADAGDDDEGLPVFQDSGDYEYVCDDRVYRHEPEAPVVYASTPPEFAEYFPSTRRLCIRHDDTSDGNMNLRVDTETQTSSGRRVDLTLFHLRMHDLRNRQFSLRRYCRDSGREVCHSSRRYSKPSSRKRPGLQRSVSNALASFMSKSSSATAAAAKNRTKASLSRTDSGYQSMNDGDRSSFGNADDHRIKEDEGDEFDVNCIGEQDEDNDDDEDDEDDNDNEDEDEDRNLHHRQSRDVSSLSIPTNTTKLEFSNYAQVDVRRRGTKSSKRYEFGYWGSKYVWRRVARKEKGRSGGVAVSYHLYCLSSSSASSLPSVPIAHIVPTPMTPMEAREEEFRGGWVPPSSMWISNPKVFSGLSDVADVIIATGLTAFVDDCIKNKWHRKDRFQLSVPLWSSSKKLGKDSITPKQLINEVFNRNQKSAPEPQSSLSRQIRC